MGTHETAVIPILTPLLLGEKIVLDEQMRRILVRWLVLKLLVAEHHQQSDQPADPIFSQEHRIQFMNNGTIPDGIRIWLSRCGQGKWSCAFFRHSIGMTAGTTAELPADIDRSRKTVQSVTWGIGLALFHISATIDPKVYPALDLFDTGPIRRLWPIRDRDIVWPPIMGLSEAEADAMSFALEELLQAPNAIVVPDVPAS